MTTTEQKPLRRLPIPLSTQPINTRNQEGEGWQPDVWRWIDEEKESETAATLRIEAANSSTFINFQQSNRGQFRPYRASPNPNFEQVEIYDTNPVRLSQIHG
jgi:hypothetical protein